MMDLNSIKIYISTDKSDSSGRKGELREDGYTVFRNSEGFIDIFELDLEKFRVSVHRSDYGVDHGVFNFVYPIFKEYFTSVDEKFIENLTAYPGVLDFDLNFYHEEPDMSEQDNMFIANYTGWIYLLFNQTFDTLFSLTDFKKVLNNKHHIHSVHDIGWMQTKMFMEKLTVEDLSSAFQRFFKLLGMERGMNEVMDKARDDFYTKNEELWINNLEG